MRNPLKFFFRPAGKAPPLREVYALFKGVLDSNNSALDVITDMGEKLGGGYLFDAVYMSRVYTELAGHMENSIGEFEKLTGGKYPDLVDAYARIDSKIRSAIDQTDVASGRLIVPFEEITIDMARETGGKNASLAELGNRAGVKIPRGFALTTHAFDLFMSHNGLDRKIEKLVGGPEPDEDVLLSLQELIETAYIPQELDSSIDAALEAMRSRCSGPCMLAVRSSAEEEDGEFSFAGQFTTVLGVPAEGGPVISAYKKVVASLYSPGAVMYQRSLGYDPVKMKMAVGCVEMVDTESSGVVFTTDPGGGRDSLLINAAWGLGTSVVDGRVDADSYAVGRPQPGGRPAVLDIKTGAKLEMSIALPEGGTRVAQVPPDKSGAACLDNERILELASQALRIEKYLGRPQDIEWAVGKDGSLYILQSRPLNVADPRRGGAAGFEAPADATVLMAGKGTAVQGGAGAGAVFIMRRDDDLDKVPDGAVLVSATDSPHIARVVHRISAVITDTGSLTSHMASVCREFRVPTLVNTGVAMGIFMDRQPVTLNIDEDGNATVYEGVIGEVVEHARARVFGMEGVDEYRRKRRVLRYISPLNLVDPSQDNFTPEGCRTIHDILRFMHERSVGELVESSKRYGEKLKGQAPVRLELPIPAGILVIDIGDGLNNPANSDRVTLDEVRSLPLKAILTGMIYPGVWHSDMVSLKAGDFMSSMVRMHDIATNAESYAGFNVAVVSREYVNMSLRFGYHFNMLDCYMSENARNNHIYFRFAGGATDIAKRSRRIHLISLILEEHGFSAKTKGDIVIARLSNITRENMEHILDQLGRLVSYTRQMDAVLNTDEEVERYAKNFAAGNYEY